MNEKRVLARRIMYNYLNIKNYNDIKLLTILTTWYKLIWSKEFFLVCTCYNTLRYRYFSNDDCNFSSYT